MLNIESKNMIEEQKAEYITVNKASKEIGINRSTIFYYMRRHEIKPKKFFLDKKTYISIADMERIKEARRIRAETQGER